MNDWLINQQDLNSSKGIIEDLDKYDDQRIINAKQHPCEHCNAIAKGPCIPMTEFEKSIRGQWIHVQRES